KFDDPLDEAREAGTNRVVNVEGNEEAQSNLLAISQIPSPRRYSTRADSESSHQRPAHHIQSHRRCQPANAFAVTGEGALCHLGAAVAGHRMEHQAHRFVRTAATGPSHPRDAHSKSRLTAVTNSFSQRCRHLAAHRTVPFNHV